MHSQVAWLLLGGWAGWIAVEYFIWPTIQIFREWRRWR